MQVTDRAEVFQLHGALIWGGQLSGSVSNPFKPYQFPFSNTSNSTPIHVYPRLKFIIEVNNDHRSKFSNLSDWTEEA